MVKLNSLLEEQKKLKRVKEAQQQKISQMFKGLSKLELTTLLESVNTEVRDRSKERVRRE